MLSVSSKYDLFPLGWSFKVTVPLCIRMYKYVCKCTHTCLQSNVSARGKSANAKRAPNEVTPLGNEHAATSLSYVSADLPLNLQKSEQWCHEAAAAGIRSVEVLSILNPRTNRSVLDSNFCER